MSGLRVTVEHNGETYTGQLATIKSTTLGWEDHGILSAMLHCEWTGGGIGVGGFCLDKSLGKDGKYEREGTAYGLDHLMRIMQTVGVDRWERLPGQQVVVLFKGESLWGATSSGIAGVLNDRVLILQEHATGWLLRNAPDEVTR